MIKGYIILVIKIILKYFNIKARRPNVVKKYTFGRLTLKHKLTQTMHLTLQYFAQTPCYICFAAHHTGK